MKRVEVEWMDTSAIKLTWAKPDDYDLPPTPVRTVGWLVHEQPDYIVLVLSHAPVADKGAFESREQVSDGVTIPRGTIQAIHELRRR